jgi:hypothetical protein
MPHVLGAAGVCEGGVAAGDVGVAAGASDPFRKAQTFTDETESEERGGVEGDTKTIAEVLDDLHVNHQKKRTKKDGRKEEGHAPEIAREMGVCVCVCV